MTTIKVKILTECDFCQGNAYLPVGEEVDSFGGNYTRYISCKYCEGSGLMSKYINLVDFVKLIDVSRLDNKDLSEAESLNQFLQEMELARIK